MKEGKSVKSNGQQHHHHQNGHLSPFKFAKLLDPEASWDKDQLGDALHWIRQAVALVCGLLWGSIPLVGGIWIILYICHIQRITNKRHSKEEGKHKKLHSPHLDLTQPTLIVPLYAS
ncbi:uncharacterized protein LOC117917149 isoform X2 [Vitis riparia]|uniref:uncharacterized protein LOC117917149 isoform X2 n=1 Tax=Vitis riparia TaxID=96939 RepID=UPI00155A21C5|nr:uncharacterized protein LOC117917149 isoform X2 [Vitis riparia]